MDVPSYVRVSVECLPEVVQALWPGPCSDILGQAEVSERNERANGGRTIKMQMFGTKSEPNALKNHRWELIFFWFRSLRRKMICVGTIPLSGYLHLSSILRNIEVVMICNLLEVQFGVQPKRRCVLKHVGRNRLPVDLVLHVFALIHSQRCETIEYSGMDLSSTVRNDADNYLYVRLKFSTIVGGEEGEGGPSSSSLDPRLCSTCVDKDGRCSS